MNKPWFLKRWEYWPAYVVYAPLVVYFLATRLFRKKLFSFTASNPALVAGGLIDEPKVEILNLLNENESNTVLPYKLIPGSVGLKDRLLLIKEFQVENDCSYPLILKPNAGQRGTGVVKVLNEQELEHFCQKMKTDYLVQMFFEGIEASVFYALNPETHESQLYSLTLKELPFVKGDGTSTLEELILKHARHKNMKAYLLQLNESSLTVIPQEGKKVILNEVGAHCKGTTFFDGRKYRTKALLKACDEILRETGLYFGRFDLFTDSIESLEQGINLKVIEFNGVSSEATHIYDPSYPFVQGLKDLIQQWKIAYDIGDANMRKGHKQTSLTEMVRCAKAYRKKVGQYLEHRNTVTK